MVSITLPAHIWMGFIYTYHSNDYTGICEGHISNAVQEAMLDPVYIKESQANSQKLADEQHQSMHQMFSGFSGMMPYIPPDAEGLTEEQE
jgi:hypothetical protein